MSWEQLLRHYKGSDIWIITNDGDYISHHNGFLYLNPFLFSELTRKGSNKTPPKISLFDSLAKGIEDFGANLSLHLNTLPSNDEFKQIIIEEAEIHLHPETVRRIVDSSNIAAIGYDEPTATLEVEFQNGGVYQYHNVPKSLYDDLLMASAKGRFFHDFIMRQGFTFIKKK